MRAHASMMAAEDDLMVETNVGVKTETESGEVAIGAWLKSRDGKWKFRKRYW